MSKNDRQIGKNQEHAIREHEELMTSEVNWVIDFLKSNIISDRWVSDSSLVTKQLKHIKDEQIPGRLRAFLWGVCLRETLPSQWNKQVIYLPIAIDSVVGCWDRRTYCPEVSLDDESCKSDTVVQNTLMPPSPKLEEALKQDSASLYELEMTLTGRRRTKNTLFHPVTYGAPNILCHLLKKDPNWVASIISPGDLLLTLCLNKGNWVPVLDTLEELFPGISRNTVDIRGNTPLWYCLYGEPGKEFEEALLRYGCNPEHKNRMNLSYNLCKEFRNR